MTEKLSFAEMQKKLDAEKVNSDLSNLAHALQYIAATRVELDAYVAKKIKELDELEAEVNSVAEKIEGGSINEYANVKKLFDKSRLIGPNI